MTTVLLCLCGCPKLDHKLGRKECKRCGACSFFELDGEVPTSRMERDQAAEVGSEAAAPSAFVFDVGAAAERLGGESTSAALRRAEQERDQANDLTDKIAAELRGVTKERDALARRCSVRFEETQAAKAELASARQEIEHSRDLELGLREQLEQLRADLAKAHAFTDEVVATARTELEQARARTGAEVFAFDAWQCLTPGGCGARYTRRTATTHHPCGPLTAVRVAITHREDHQ